MGTTCGLRRRTSVSGNSVVPSGLPELYARSIGALNDV